MKRIMWLTLLCLAGASQLSAQDSTAIAPYPWRTSYFPYLTLSPNDGVMALARLVHFRQARWGDRVSLRDALAVEAGYSTKKSWLIRARGDFPRIADGWRVEADAQISRTPRFGNPDQFQERDARSLNLEVTRRVRGPLLLAARMGIEHVKQHLSFFNAATLYPGTPAESPCEFFADPSHDTNLDACSPTITQSDRQGRLALVLDLRDREFDTRTGALLEAGLFTGSAGDGYHGSYGLARGWVLPRPSTRVTARLGFRDVSRSAAIGIQHEIPAWEHAILTLGGPQSERGLGMGEEPGRGLLLGGAEVRQELKQFVNGLASISAIAFVDGGRAFRDPSPLLDLAPGAPIPSGNLQFTLKNWQWSVGGGIAIQVLKDSRLTVTAARGDGHTRWYMSSGWAW